MLSVCVFVCVCPTCGLSSFASKGGVLLSTGCFMSCRDTGREVNISVTILRRWSVEVPRTWEESVRCCNFIALAG